MHSFSFGASTHRSTAMYYLTAKPNRWRITGAGGLSNKYYESLSSIGEDLQKTAYLIAL